MKLLTNLIFEPKGVHDPALTYSIKDTVMSPDGSKVYFALRDVPSGIALTDEDYWMLQIDLSGSKNAMDEAVAAFADYAKIVGTRVKGETAKATGNPATFLPDAGSLLQPVTVLEPQQAGSGDPYPAGGGKNLLPNTATSQTINGVTFTVNADGSITASGTATDVVFFNVGRVMLESGITYILSGCPDGGNNGGNFLMYVSIGSEFYYDFGSSVSFEGTGEERSAFIQVKSGATVNATFHPMIRLASDPDSTYAPYSNIRPFIGYDKLDLNHAGKNLLPNMATSQTINGVTFTINADGTVTANGTATADAILTIANTTGSGNAADFTGYVLSGCPAGGSSNTYFIRYSNKVNGTANDYGTGAIIGCEYTGEFTVSVRVKSGYTASNLVFKPMIRLASDTDPTFQPYTNTLYTAQIGQTVYGFRYEWLTGKGAIEWAMVTLTDNHGFYLGDVGEAKRLTVVGVIPGADNEGNGENVSLYCSHYKVNPAPIGSNSVNNAICGYQQDGNVYIRDDRFNTYEEAAAYFAAQNAAGTPVQVCWKLAQPIEIQLTPHIISAVELEQNNTLYGDGTIEVEYVKPLHVSIEERVAAALAAAAE